MKLLKIEKKQGYFYLENGDYATVDKLTKEHLLKLVDLTLSDEEVEFDEYSIEKIGNQAHQIVYQSVYEKLLGLRARKQEFIDDTETLYLADYEKYKADTND